jgi:DNA-binding NtrC family response regulator
VDLTAAVSSGAFRDDLYYRLNVVHLTVPPLRERREDIPLLVSHFVRRYNHEFGKRLEGLAPEALQALCVYDWPGNVRELQNVVERSVVLVESGIIGLDDLPLELSVVASGPDSGDAVPLNEASDRFERQMVLRMLDRVEGNVSEAARALGIHRNSLKAKLARWKIRARDIRGGGSVQ